MSENNYCTINIEKKCYILTSKKPKLKQVVSLSNTNGQNMFSLYQTMKPHMGSRGISLKFNSGTT